MIPARIISISDKVMVKYRKKISSSSGFMEFIRLQVDPYIDIIAEVENCWLLARHKYWIEIGNSLLNISIGDSCFIEPTSEGKAKIVKI